MNKLFLLINEGFITIIATVENLGHGFAKKTESFQSGICSKKRDREAEDRKVEIESSELSQFWRVTHIPDPCRAVYRGCRQQSRDCFGFGFSWYSHWF